jgi:hypothetical protein
MNFYRGNRLTSVGLLVPLLVRELLGSARSPRVSGRTEWFVLAILRLECGRRRVDNWQG